MGRVVNSIGYDPARIVLLRSRVRESIAALRSIRSADPAAATALRVVRLLRQNLEDSWLPLVDALHESTAMSEWRQGAELVGVAGVAGVIHQFGAVSRWIPTLGMDHVPDRRLVDALGAAAGRFDHAVISGRDDVDVASRALRRISRETARRLESDRDGEFAALLHERLGQRGVQQLLHGLDSTGELRRFDTWAEGGPAGHVLGIQRSIGVILGRLAAVDQGVLDALVDKVAMSSVLADVVARDPVSFEPRAVAALAAELVAHVAGVGRWASAPRVVVDVAGRADALLEVVSSSPNEALMLLAEPELGAALVTSERFDSDAVEALVSSGLGTAAATGPRQLAASFEVLSSLVAITAEHRLNPGARRGAALAFGTYLPAVAIQLDHHLPVLAALPSSTVEVGSYAELSRFLGQILDDEPAQLALGVVVGAFRLDQLRSSTAAIQHGPDRGVAETRAQLASTLADVGRVVDLLEDARRRHDRFLALEHGMAQARSIQLVTLLGIGVSMVAPPSTPLVRQINSLTTRGITAAIGASRPETVPSTGLEAELSMHATVSAAAVPLRSPLLRSRLGLDAVPESVWAELDDLVSAFDSALDGAADGRTRQVLHSRIRHLLSSHPDLDAYAEDTRLRSG